MFNEACVVGWVQNQLMKALHPLRINHVKKHVIFVGDF